MTCESCQASIAKNSVYCNYCGSKQTQAVKNQYTKPYGTWKVTTEGDVEGRTTTNLGIHTGYVDEIARMLSGAAYYKLEFSMEPELKINKLPKKEVHISFDIDSGTWDDNNQRLQFFKNVFQNRNVRVEPSNYYAAVKLVFPE